MFRALVVMIDIVIHQPLEIVLSFLPIEKWAVASGSQGTNTRVTKVKLIQKHLKIYNQLHDWLNEDGNNL